MEFSAYIDGIQRNQNQMTLNLRIDLPNYQPPTTKDGYADSTYDELMEKYNYSQMLRVIAERLHTGNCLLVQNIMDEELGLETKQQKNKEGDK